MAPAVVSAAAAPVARRRRRRHWRRQRLRQRHSSSGRVGLCACATRVVGGLLARGVHLGVAHAADRK
eukprot:5233472-Prymnesium_polylepis.1